MSVQDKKAFLEYLRGTWPHKAERWMTIEEAHVLHTVVKISRCKNYFESGTANGFSSCWAALARAKNITTWDPIDRPKIWNLESELRTLGNLITYKQEKFEDGLPSIANREGTSLFFIDGNHSPTPFKKESRALLRNIRKGDWIIFHDTRAYPHIKARFKSMAGEKWLIETKNGMGIVRGGD